MISFVILSALWLGGSYAYYLHSIDCGEKREETLTVGRPTWPDPPYTLTWTPSKDYRGQCWVTKEMTVKASGKVIAGATYRKR